MTRSATSLAPQNQQPTFVGNYALIRSAPTQDEAPFNPSPDKYGFAAIHWRKIRKKAIPAQQSDKLWTRVSCKIEGVPVQQGTKQFLPPSRSPRKPMTYLFFFYNALFKHITTAQFQFCHCLRTSWAIQKVETSWSGIRQKPSPDHLQK